MRTENGNVIYVEEVPIMDWLTEEGKLAVRVFNHSAEFADSLGFDPTEYHLGLELFEDEVVDGTWEETERLIEDGRFNYVFPSENPVSQTLQKVVEDSAKNGRYFYFGSKSFFIVD